MTTSSTLPEPFTDEPWAPTLWTRPLGPQIVSDGVRLILLVERYWRTPDGEKVVLDDWQKQLLIAVLERYPDDWHVESLRGRLRYRQVVISLGRQNGKSLLAAILSLYGLVQHQKGPLVIGVASTREQAEVVYSRTHYVIRNTPALHKRIKPTGTRGLRYRDGGGSYEMRASKGEALQGLPISLGLADELHLMDPFVWDSIVNGQRAQENGILIGITTAGDETSELLKRLYAQGQAAVEAEASRFGFFLWEAPEGSTIDTPGAIEAANPSVACGRLDVETVRSDVRSLPEHDQQRFTLNRFVASLNSWMPLAQWRGLETGSIPEGAKVIFTVERAENWRAATITASAKVGNKVYTEVVASLVNPDIEQLEEFCLTLRKKHKPIKFVMESWNLKDLALRLREKGVDVEYLTQSQVINACATTYALIAEGRVIHGNDWVVNTQMPRAVAKNIGDGWRISRKESTGDVDAVLATVLGLYAAETIKPKAPALFVA